MEVIQKGEVPKNNGYDMMCFRQHGGCSAVFRFKVDDIKEEIEILQYYYIECPTCKRKIYVKQRTGGWFTPGKPIIPFD